MGKMPIPVGYDVAIAPQDRSFHPQAEYLKNKSWYLQYAVPDEQLADAKPFIIQAVELFEWMKPFNDYLNSALKEFKMPTR